MLVQELLRQAESKKAAEVLLKITGIASTMFLWNLEILTGISNAVACFCRGGEN